MAASGNVEGKIRAIDRAAVHRICSGQVVLDLATAVKELVENSLDAGATSVDIRLKDHGAELIEVADNGTGVSTENYQALTLKYHTSKISKFVDLQSLSSFGFRGEALSSLCALAKVTIVTRTKDDSVAVRLEYDHSGLIVSQQNVARSVGTTVSIVKLFSPLPVRFKEFRRDNNIRREYGRLLSILQAYALVAKGVRLICSNQTGRAGRTVVLQTQGNTSMKDNIVTVFGSKTAASMERLDLVVSDSCIVEGFISKPGAGCGRPSGDRQFFYVNGRPVDIPKFAKLLNELYRSYNSQQFPMLVLNFILPTTSYDVNVTPDKRKLFLHSESELIASLRESLEKVYAPTKYTYTVNNLESGPLTGKTTSLAKSLGTFSRNAGKPIHSDAPEDSSSDEDREDEAENRKGGVASVLEETVETETTVSGRARLNLLSFQHKIIKRPPDGKLDRTSETEPVLSASCGIGKNLPNVLTKRTIQAALPSFVPRTKRLTEESGGALLSEQPLLKQWRQSNLIVNEDEDEREGFHYDSTGVHSATGCNTEGPPQEDEEGLLSLCEEDDTDVDPAPNATTPMIRMVPCSNAGLHKRSSGCNAELPAKDDGEVLPPCGENDANFVIASNATIHARRMAPCSSVGLEKRLPFGPSIDSEAVRGKVGVGRKVAEAKHQFHHRQPDMCSEPVQADGRNGSPVLATKLSASEKKVDQVDESGKKPEWRPVIQFNMEKLRKKLELGLLQGQMTNSTGRRQKLPKSSCFAAATLNVAGKEGVEKEAMLAAATKELERSFNKADFKKMKVLGQFNLGFILAKIDEDIFIIDQHASDEKYNFERLSKTTVLNRQPLLRPLRLELSAAEEMTAVSHIETFRQNGFDFIDDEKAPVGNRLQLSAVPFSQNVTFGVGDVQELISLLADEPVMSFQSATDLNEHSSDHGHHGKVPQKASGWFPRPSRVRAMLASRACRSSIMIGDHLSKKEMERVLSHLAELDSPWNCPHGRPTMRHLVDLSTITR